MTPTNRADEIEPAHAGEEAEAAADDAEQRRRAEIGLMSARTAARRS